MKLAQFILKLRYDLKLTQVEFAKKIKMKQSTISGWENGTRSLSNMSAKRLKHFCSSVGIDINTQELF